jgi:hypothetical protein
MRITVFIVVAVLLASCGSGSDEESPRSTAASASSAATPSSGATAAAPGVYLVGTDIPAGVWTNRGDCAGIAASSREYDLETGTDPDAYLTSSLPVGDVARIVLQDGQFFHAEECDTAWTLEDARSPKTNDPTTIEGACRIMLDGPDDLLRQTLSFPRPKSSSAARLSATIQEQLFTIVASGQETLAEPVGVLVDFLDDPRAYSKDGKPDDSITQAAATIRNTCADQ